jgi:hypothetical protein
MLGRTIEQAGLHIHNNNSIHGLFSDPTPIEH